MLRRDAAQLRDEAGRSRENRAPRQHALDFLAELGHTRVSSSRVFLDRVANNCLQVAGSSRSQITEP